MLEFSLVMWFFLFYLFNKYSWVSYESCVTGMGVSVIGDGTYAMK